MSKSDDVSTIIVVIELKKHDKMVMERERTESFAAAKSAAKGNPDVLKWLKDHKEEIWQ
jgi:hypothetical protein